MTNSTKSRIETNQFSMNALLLNKSFIFFTKVVEQTLIPKEICSHGIFLLILVNQAMTLIRVLKILVSFKTYFEQKKQQCFRFILCLF